MLIELLLIAACFLMILLLYKNSETKFNREKYTDTNGYYRWKDNNRLVHRDIAFNEIYKKLYREGKLKERFREYIVHHKDMNKLNNNVNNLEIMKKSEHQKIHEIKNL